MIRVGTFAWRRCACPGCQIDIYAPVHVEARCKAHGGPGYFEQPEPDEWGELPVAAAAGPPPVADRAHPEAS